VADLPLGPDRVISGNSLNREPSGPTLGSDEKGRGAAVRVMYVEDCPQCGCPMIAGAPDVMPSVLATAAACPDAGCACHASRHHVVTG
jgi:hypothetical protein